MIHVTCAIIEKGRKILAAQRSSAMSHPLKWEFPGGKIEESESPEACLQREIQEELNLNIEIVCPLPGVEQHYGPKHILLLPFVCRILSGTLHLQEHAAVCWDSPEKIEKLDLAEADVKVLAHYRAYKSL